MLGLDVRVSKADYLVNYQGVNMSPENHVIIYAVRSAFQHLIEQGLIDEQAFKNHMSEAEFNLRKGLSPDAKEASLLISNVFGVITSNIDD